MQQNIFVNPIADLDTVTRIRKKIYLVLFTIRYEQKPDPLKTLLPGELKDLMISLLQENSNEPFALAIIHKNDVIIDSLLKLLSKERMGESYVRTYLLTFQMEKAVDRNKCLEWLFVNNINFTGSFKLLESHPGLRWKAFESYYQPPPCQKKIHSLLPPKIQETIILSDDDDDDENEEGKQIFTKEETAKKCAQLMKLARNRFSNNKGDHQQNLQALKGILELTFKEWLLIGEEFFESFSNRNEFFRYHNGFNLPDAPALIPQLTSINLPEIQDQISKYDLNAQYKFCHKYEDLKQHSGAICVLDCEMAHYEVNGQLITKVISLTILNEEGSVLFSRLLKPPGFPKMTQSHIHGISIGDIINAIYIDNTKEKIKMILDNKIIVGFAVINDIVALLQSGIQFKPLDVWDISRFSKFYQKTNNTLISLEKLVREIFRKKMPPYHKDKVDARATLFLYKLFEKDMLKEDIRLFKEDSQTRTLTRAAEIDKKILKASKPFVQKFIWNYFIEFHKTFDFMKW